MRREVTFRATHTHVDKQREIAREMSLTIEDRCEDTRVSRLLRRVNKRSASAREE